MSESSPNDVDNLYFVCHPCPLSFHCIELWGFKKRSDSLCTDYIWSLWVILKRRVFIFIFREAPPPRENCNYFKHCSKMKKRWPPPPPHLNIWGANLFFRIFQKAFRNVCCDKTSKIRRISEETMSNKPLTIFFGLFVLLHVCVHFAFNNVCLI